MPGSYHHHLFRYWLFCSLGLSTILFLCVCSSPVLACPSRRWQPVAHGWNLFCAAAALLFFYCATLAFVFNAGDRTDTLLPDRVPDSGYLQQLPFATTATNFYWWFLHFTLVEFVGPTFYFVRWRVYGYARCPPFGTRAFFSPRAVVTRHTCSRSPLPSSPALHLG